MSLRIWGRGPDEPPDRQPLIEHKPATCYGWLKRPEIGFGVWERPDGSLYKHFNNSVPMISSIRFHN